MTTAGAEEEPQPLTVHSTVESHPVEETSRVEEPSESKDDDDSEVKEKLYQS